MKKQTMFAVGLGMAMALCCAGCGGVGAVKDEKPADTTVDSTTGTDVETDADATGDTNANTRTNAQRLRDEPLSSGKFIIDFTGSDNAPIYQLGKTTVGELEDGTELCYSDLEWDDTKQDWYEITTRTCEPEAEEELILINSEYTKPDKKSIDTWGFDVHLTIANRTGEETSYRNCTIVAISNIDHIMVPGGAHTDMGWDELAQVYGKALVEEEHLIVDGTGQEKFCHVDGEDGQGRVSFQSWSGVNVSAIDYDIRGQIRVVDSLLSFLRGVPGSVSQERSVP